MLVIPVSYERTTGHDVRLSLSGGQLAMSGVGEVARGLKAALGADQVRMEAQLDDGVPRFELSAFVPAGSRTNVAAVAQAYAHGLEEKGYQASAEVSARKERVSGSVYAYARDRVIRISTDGKSAAQLESEIRQRLAESGVPNAEVSVTDFGENGRKITINADQMAEGDGSARIEEGFPEVELTRDGQPLQGKGLAVRVKKEATGAGTALSLEINDSGRTVTVRVPNADAMSDAALAAEIETQLEQAGFDLKVQVNGGQVQIEKQ
jgi:hypothetical protein